MWPDQDSEKYTTVDGTFKGIRFYDKEIAGEQVRVFDLLLEDDGTEYIVQSGMTGVARSLLNCLISLTEIGHLELSLYRNKKGYPNVGVKHNGENVSWKLSFDEQEAKVVSTPLPKGKTHRDYTELQQYLEDECAKFVVKEQEATLEEEDISDLF